MVVCHCDGILCLVKDNASMDVMLCSPVLQDFKLLPQSKNAETHNVYSGIGFGYDSKADDYKFVKVLNCHKAVAEIYTLGTDSWREVSMPEDIQGLPFRAGLYWKGVCYWEIEDKEKNDMILSFDIRDEFASARRAWNLSEGNEASFETKRRADRGSSSSRRTCLDYANS
ncbi:hypothetical protein TIFTF001_013158 [Ficus carica]|uniref:F-box associated beta-propeller type 1 domain-containing protein n=1 Tax=Ficus carica TaxID=3494 RepID=A0AA88D4C0_FICCA|nr:hypothetical protein TIFTF001_013158 [Ficus carica]